MLDEIWITDEKGHAYLRNISEIDFTFSPNPKQQPQAHVFWPLLTGKTKSVVQEARQREVDTQVFKYVGVTGVDKPRIVQVGLRRLSPTTAAAHGADPSGQSAGFRRKRHRDPRPRQEHDHRGLC